MNPFLTKLTEQPLLIDGAMGTVLFAKGVSGEQCLEQLVLDQPAWVSDVHQAYASAGTDIIKTHTFGANRVRLQRYNLADQVRQINFAATRLVRDVREVAGRAIFIAGDIGPLGKRLEPTGTLSVAEAREVFHEQVSVLWEAGADLLFFETFSDLAELTLAVTVAKELCDLPIVASMTFAEDGLTPAGLTPATVTERLLAAGADVLGVNCSVGPAPMLQTLEAFHHSAEEQYLSAIPNAGFPDRVNGRFSYPAGPEYFARHVIPFLDRGVRLLGGCCGTTPTHTWAMRGALDSYLAEQAGGAVAQESVPTEVHDPTGLQIELASDYGSSPDAEPTTLLQKIRAGKFVISVEVDPPRGFNAQKQIEGAKHAKAMGADAVNVADSPMARVRMGAMALCTMIQQQAEIETILHFTTRDRSLMGLQSDLIGGRALGVRNILALTGDPPSLGDNQESTPVYDLDSIGLVRVIERFNQGLDQSGRKMGQSGGFTIAVACDPTRPDLAEEVDRFHQKVSGGAHFTMTQPIYEPQLWRNFLALYEERHGPFPVPVMIGVLPLQSHKHANFLHNEVPGITLSEDSLERMRLAGSEGRQEGVKMAQELLVELKDLPHVKGVYLMPSFGRYELACQVLEVVQEKV